MEPKVVFEDQALMVVDKPSGWIVNDADTTKDQPTIQKWLRENYKLPIFSFPELRNGVVHRLDKETSGLLLVAKTVEAFENLQAQFKSRQVKKSYIALVHGLMDLKEGIIDAPVGRLPWRRDRFGVLLGGREAKTNYTTLERFVDAYTLLELRPETGRTHQIRIHLKHIGHPIVSDSFYAGRKTNRKDRKWCPRLFLHASKISFLHPESKKILVYTSDLATDLRVVLDLLERKGQSQ